MEFWPEFLAHEGLQEFVAGGVGGMAGILAGHPLDTIRVRLQVAGGHGARPSALRTMREIVRAEGPLALYKGMATPLATVAFQNAVTFHVYGLLARALRPADAPRGEPLSYGRVALAGMGAGTVQALMLTPVDLVKIRLQLGTERVGSAGRRIIPPKHGPQAAAAAAAAPGPLRTVREILAREGVRGLYRGFGVTVLRDAPAHAVYFTTYEAMRERLHPGCRRGGAEGMLTMLLAGGTAGALSWLICYPIDVAKSRIQAPGSKYRGLVDCLQRSVREEGYGVLFRGVGVTVARAFVVNAAIFTAYEMSLRAMAPMPAQELGF